ncbi:MAG TPA: hypothetical protein PJ982_06200, partial [Lacipirellulaceae bacterium]|nr:hypothetical protein [Lacipirellulaceae bacterium]
NVHKGPNIAGVDAATGAVVPLFHPREDDWGVHFQWQDDELVGLTPRGRATIHVLAINAPHRVALRASLRREGVAFT